MRQPPKVGQTLYSLNVNASARGNTPQVLTPVMVTSVGRKYFTCNGATLYRDSKYRLEDWYQVVSYGSPDSELYWSEEAYKEKVEGDAICKELGDAFRYGGNAKKVSISNLRLMGKLLNERTA